MEEKERPWLNAKGRRYPLEKLKEISKDWSLETWRAYANALSVPLTENLAENFEKTMGTYCVRRLPDSDREFEAVVDPRIDAALATLSPAERVVLRSIFWDGLSEREVSLRFKISRWATPSLRESGLRKIRSYFDCAPAPLPRPALDSEYVAPTAN